MEEVMYEETGKTPKEEAKETEEIIRHAKKIKLPNEASLFWKYIAEIKR